MKPQGFLKKYLVGKLLGKLRSKPWEKSNQILNLPADQSLIKAVGKLRSSSKLTHWVFCGQID